MSGNRHFPKAAVSFAAKTGFITKDLWLKYFFGGGKLRWQQQAWKDFVLRGYFVPHSCRRIQNVYVLNCYNREISDFLGQRPVHPPATSLLDHDEILVSGMLCLERGRALAHWTTEGELKAMGKNAFRIETQGTLIKYPDVLVLTGESSPERPVAIELEKTLKNRSRYAQIMAAYGAMKGIRSLLFVCESAAIENAVMEQAKATYFPVNEVALGFARLEQWRHDAGGMEIRVGRECMTWARFSTLRISCAGRRAQAA